MEDYNQIPKTGTIGGMVDNVNANFQLTKEMLERLEVTKDHAVGLFSTLASLQTAYPTPEVGDWALVGDTTPFAIYKCLTAGTWSDTGGTYDGGSIDLGDYATKAELANNIIPYMEEVALSADLSAKELKRFIIDFKVLETRVSGYDYGIIHLNNDSPQGTKYYIGVYRWPSNEDATSANRVLVGGYSASTLPSNGLITVSGKFAVYVNWGAASGFGYSSINKVILPASKFDQDYIFDLKRGVIAELTTQSDLTRLQNDVNEDIGAMQNTVNALEQTIGVDKTVDEIVGQITYYEQYGLGYAAKGVAQRSNKFATADKINLVKVGPLKTTASKSVNYAIMDCQYSVYSIVPNNVGTIIQQGMLAITDTFAQYDINVPETQIAAGHCVVVFFWSDTNIRILGTDYTTSVNVYTGTFQSIFNASPSDTPLAQTWSISSTGDNRFRTCSPILSYKTSGLASEVATNRTNIASLTNRVSALEGGVSVNLPNTIYAIVGDTLQMFFRGIIQAVDPYQYNIIVKCSKGNQYPRYFEYTPKAADVGTTTITIEVYNDNGNLLASASSNLVTKAAVSQPSSAIKVMCFGDSLTNGGAWPHEADRRLTESGGTPSGNAFGNIDFVGVKTLSGTGYCGYGGWTWSDYCTQGRKAYRFQVSGVSSVSIGAVYTNNGNTFTVVEVNVTGGTGSILCSVSSYTPAPDASGTLTKSSGNGDASITYSSAAQDSANPLWDYNNSKMTFVKYANDYGGGTVDVVYVLLSWNGLSARQTDFSAFIGYLTTFADTLHTEFPNAKLKLMGLQIPSVRGGMGANYGASGTGYADQYGMLITAMNLNKAYQDFANDASYSSFVEFVDIASQFDTEYNMQHQWKINGVVVDEIPVNTRNSQTEYVDSNGVHPATSGYYQIADVVYRNFIANFCQ